METKILPLNYTDDLEKVMMDEKCGAVGIEKMSITYIQPADICSSSDKIQTITITTQYCAASTLKEADNQNGFYFNITIPEGQHWSIDDGDSLVALIEDFKKRLYMKTEH
jgi:hypothetical protein